MWEDLQAYSRDTDNVYNEYSIFTVTSNSALEHNKYMQN